MLPHVVISSHTIVSTENHRKPLPRYDEILYQSAGQFCARPRCDAQSFQHLAEPEGAVEGRSLLPTSNIFQPQTQIINRLYYIIVQQTWILLGWNMLKTHENTSNRIRQIYYTEIIGDASPLFQSFSLRGIGLDLRSAQLAAARGRQRGTAECCGAEGAPAVKAAVGWGLAQHRGLQDLPWQGRLQKHGAGNELVDFNSNFIADAWSETWKSNWTWRGKN